MEDLTRHLLQSQTRPRQQMIRPEWNLQELLALALQSLHPPCLQEEVKLFSSASSSSSSSWAQQLNHQLRSASLLSFDLSNASALQRFSTFPSLQESHQGF